MRRVKNSDQQPALERLPRSLGLITQTEQSLRQAIDEGRFASGRLPTEVELAEQLGVSRETVRLATERLQRDGLITKIRRRGTFLREGISTPLLKTATVSTLGYLQADYPSREGKDDAVTRAVGALMLQGAISEAGKHGHQMVVQHAPFTQLTAIADQLCQGNRLQGMIFASCGEEKVLKRVLGNGLPVVLLDHDLTLPRISSVREDSFSGGLQAVAHLVGLGHDAIAYVHWRHTELNPWRLQGYRQGLRDAGIRRRRAWEFFVELTPEGARTVVDSWSRLTARPTAFYIFNNTLAKLIIEELRSRDIKVPDEISIVGGGGEEVPGLTCHQADWTHLGRVAVQIVLKKLGRPQHYRGAHVMRQGMTTRQKERRPRV